MESLILVFTFDSAFAYLLFSRVWWLMDQLEKTLHNFVRFFFLECKDFYKLSVRFFQLKKSYCQFSRQFTHFRVGKFLKLKMSLKDVSDWSHLLDRSCQVPTDIVFDVIEEVTKEDGTVQQV